MAAMLFKLSHVYGCSDLLKDDTAVEHFKIDSRFDFTWINFESLAGIEIGVTEINRDN